MFKWVGPVIGLTFVIIAPKYKDIKIEKFDDLLKYRVGTVRDDAAEQLLVAKGYPKALLKDVSRPYQNAKKLQYNRIDMWAYPLIPAKWVLKENNLNPSNYEAVYSILEGDKLYFAFNKNIPDSIVNKFQKVFDELKSKGIVKKIINSYVK